MKDQVGWGIREHDRTPVHVSEVPRGLDCGCICSRCGKPLIAKKGDEREHHFAHRELGDCKYQGETELHARAKQILAAKREITTRDGVLRFQDARIEERVGRYKVDVYLVSEELNLAVEIFVSHRIDSHKHRYFVDSRTHSMEIDLTGAPIGISPEDLADLVTNRPDLQREIYFPSRSTRSGSATNKVRSTIPGSWSEEGGNSVSRDVEINETGSATAGGPERDSLREIGRFHVGDRERIRYKARNGVMIERWSNDSR